MLRLWRKWMLWRRRKHLVAEKNGIRFYMD